MVSIISIGTEARLSSRLTQAAQAVHIGHGNSSPSEWVTWAGRARNGFQPLLFPGAGMSNFYP